MRKTMLLALAMSLGLFPSISAQQASAAVLNPSMTATGANTSAESGVTKVWLRYGGPGARYGWGGGPRPGWGGPRYGWGGPRYGWGGWRPGWGYGPRYYWGGGWGPGYGWGPFALGLGVGAAAGAGAAYYGSGPNYGPAPYGGCGGGGCGQDNYGPPLK